MASLPCPADSELAILRVLWGRGSCSVREVHEVITVTRPVGYTTVLKTLQIMTEKGLVRRDEQRKAHRYRASLPAPRVQKQLVDDLVERAFGGAAAELVMHALMGRKSSAAEIARLRELLDSLDPSQRPGGRRR